MIGFKKLNWKLNLAVNCGCFVTESEGDINWRGIKWGKGNFKFSWVVLEYCKIIQAFEALSLILWSELISLNLQK